MRTLQVRRLGYALGAEVTGIDLRERLRDEVVAEIRQLWLDHIVLCFPGQNLGLEEMRAFCGRFGVLEDNRAQPEVQHPDASDVMVLVNNPLTVNDKRFSGGIADQWHSDLAFSIRPATATFLNAKELPDVGGDTIFTSMYAAYDALSPAFKKMIEPLEAVHDGNLAAPVLRLSLEEQAIRRRLAPPVVHSVVRVHPDTGRKALYAGHRIRHFVGMTEDETRPLLDFLNRHAVSYEFSYRHVWRDDDFLMWDNRCAMHIALRDYDLAQTRRMLRCSLLAPKSGRYYEPGVDDASVRSEPAAVSASG